MADDMEKMKRAKTDEIENQKQIFQTQIDELKEKIRILEARKTVLESQKIKLKRPSRLQKNSTTIYQEANSSQSTLSK